MSQKHMRTALRKVASLEILENKNNISTTNNCIFIQASFPFSKNKNVVGIKNNIKIQTGSYCITRGARRIFVSS